MPELYDIKFRVQVPNDSVVAEAGRWIKSSTRDEERQRFKTALQAFWGPFAYKDRPELGEVALESIMELTEQILQIALVAGLPIEQLNFKSEVLALIQQIRQGTIQDSSTAPKTGTLPKTDPVGKNGAVESKPPPKAPAQPAKRRTLFED